MKLLLVADLHYTLRQWDWLVDTAPYFDIVVIAGDLLDIGSIVPFSAQIVVVQKYLERVHPVTELLVSSGNHDIIQLEKTDARNANWLLESRRQHLHTDYDFVEIGDYCFSILPWWDTLEAKAELETLLHSHQKKATGKRWIWVHHAPPYGSPISWDGQANMGDNTLPKWIKTYNPDIVLSGHIHQAPFYAKGSWIDKMEKTWIINSGRQIGNTPTATILDLETREARWVSMEDSGTATLI